MSLKNKKKIKNVLATELDSLLPNIIIENEDGSYGVYGVYTIRPNINGFEVSKHDRIINVFGAKKSALSWCIADNQNHQTLAQELLYLDKRLADVTNDIIVRSSIAKMSDDQEFKELVGNKLDLRVYQKNTIECRLKKCINIIKYWQQRGFNNEITRSSQKAVIKTSI